MAPAAAPCGGGRWGPSFPLGVGAGIPDGPGWNAPWTRQGCRVPRNGYAFAPVRRLTLPGTTRRHTQVPPYEYDGLSRVVCGGGMHHRSPLRHKAAVHHPLTGWGRRPSALPGDCAICGWRFGTLGVFRPLRRAGVSRRARRGCFARCGGRVFRAVRGAGVSPAAAGGCFAGCGQRPGALPPGPLRFFEKNRVKLLFLGASGKKRTRCRSSASLFIQFTASWNSPATAGQPEHG